MIDARECDAGTADEPLRVAERISGLRAVARCDRIGCAPYSDEPHSLFRPYLGPAHRATLDILDIWMRDAGMTTRIDAAIVADTEHVVMAWPLATDGRKRLAAAAVLSADGEVLAQAQALLIELRAD